MSRGGDHQRKLPLHAGLENMHGAVGMRKIDDHVGMRLNSQIGHDTYADRADTGNFPRIMTEFWMMRSVQRGNDREARILLGQGEHALPHPTTSAIDSNVRFH